MGMMRFGTHPVLEAEANRLLHQSLKGVTSHAAKSDILTPWKEQERHRREVQVTSGTPDPAIRKGMYGRAVNRTLPHLNSRDGVAPPHRIPSAQSVSTHSLEQFLEQYGRPD